MRPRERARLAQERAERAALRAREVDDRVAQLQAVRPWVPYRESTIQASRDAHATEIANSVELARAATVAARLAHQRAACVHERAARAFLRAAERYRKAGERAGPEAREYRALVETCLSAAQRKWQEASAARHAAIVTAVESCRAPAGKAGRPAYRE